MGEYCEKYENLIYKKTEAKQFLNQVEAFKLASGSLIKFVNHRSLLREGTIQYFVDFAKKNQEKKPGIYFMDGAISGKSGQESFDDFNQYVAGLRQFSSWSAGTTMWKEDFDKMKNHTSYNATFPHTDFVFSEKKKEQYIIDHTKLFDMLPTDETKKGKYDLFYAFAVEYPGLLLDLCREGHISKETFLSIKKDILVFLGQHYYAYVLRKKPCSYDLSSYKTSIQVFYSNFAVWRMIVQIALKKIFCRGQ
jgi:hypothetical protein